MSGRRKEKWQRATNNKKEKNHSRRAVHLPPNSLPFFGMGFQPFHHFSVYRKTLLFLITIQNPIHTNIKGIGYFPGFVFCQHVLFSHDVRQAGCTDSRSLREIFIRPYFLFLHQFSDALNSLMIVSGIIDGIFQFHGPIEIVDIHIKFSTYIIYCAFGEVASVFIPVYGGWCYSDFCSKISNRYFQIAPQFS